MSLRTHFALRLSVASIPFFLGLLCMPTTAQVFPGINTKDSTASRWSLTFEASIGPTGLTRDSLNKQGDTIDGWIPSYEEEEDQDQNPINLGILFPASSILGYSAEAVLNYRIAPQVTAGISAGYDVRGISRMEIQVDSNRFSSATTTVRYATSGIRISAGCSSVTGGIGFRYGYPLSATASGYSYYTTRGTYEYNLIKADQFSIPHFLALELQLQFPIFKFSSQVLSAGLAWDIAFNNLLTTSRTWENAEDQRSSTTALHLELNWSFEL